MPKEVKVGGHPVDGKPFTFIGGPCVIEGRDATLAAAERLAAITSRLHIPFIFKSSYDKANRTSIEGFQGAGDRGGPEDPERSEGLFRRARAHGRPFAAARQPLRRRWSTSSRCRRSSPGRPTCFSRAGGRAGWSIIKKGQFLAPDDMVYALRKVESTGNAQILVTERGTSFGYHNLVNDFRSLPIMREFGYPVIFDATHSVQLPGGAGGSSAGRREFVFPLARAAVAVGVEGIFMEVHEDPAHALCDGENSVRLDEVAGMLEVLKRIGEAL